jgi:hypothetical protein
MIIAPIVFVTFGVGVAKLSDAREVGRIGVKAIVYFEVMTTIAMFIGLIVAHVIQSGPAPRSVNLDSKAVATCVNAAHQDVVTFLLNITPNTVAGAFSKDEILPVLLFAVMFGLGLSRMGEYGTTLCTVWMRPRGTPPIWFGRTRPPRWLHARGLAGPFIDLRVNLLPIDSRLHRMMWFIHQTPLGHGATARGPDSSSLSDLRHLRNYRERSLALAKFSSGKSGDGDIIVQKLLIFG